MMNRIIPACIEYQKDLAEAVGKFIQIMYAGRNIVRGVSNQCFKSFFSYQMTKEAGMQKTPRA